MSEGNVDLISLGEPLLEFNDRGLDAAGRRLYLEAHGGDASNVAVAAARQGARVAFASAVGDDIAGRSFLALWAAEGIDASAVRVDPDHPTGLYLVSHGPAGHSFSYVRRGSAASRYGAAALPRELIAQAAILFASGISLAISESAADAVFAAMDLARRAGRRVAFDTNYRPKLWPKARAAALIGAALAAADIALPGLEDAELLLGLTDPHAVVDHVLARGPSVVVLKMGAAGCVVATPEHRTTIPAFACVPVDATGAGDTFCGAFLAELARGQTPVEAATYATCAAALSTMGFGAVQPMPRRAEVLAALAAAR